MIIAFGNVFVKATIHATSLYPHVLTLFSLRMKQHHCPTHNSKSSYTWRSGAHLTTCFAIVITTSIKDIIKKNRDSIEACGNDLTGIIFDLFYIESMHIASVFTKWGFSFSTTSQQHRIYWQINGKRILTSPFWALSGKAHSLFQANLFACMTLFTQAAN